MSDQSLLKDLEQFQELSEPESETVLGGINNSNLVSLKKISSVDFKYLNLGACPTCRSGVDPIVTHPYEHIIKDLKKDQLV